MHRPPAGPTTPSVALTGSHDPPGVSFSAHRRPDAQCHQGPTHPRPRPLRTPRPTRRGDQSLATSLSLAARPFADRQSRREFFLSDALEQRAPQDGVRRIDFHGGSGQVSGGGLAETRSRRRCRATCTSELHLRPQALSAAPTSTRTSPASGPMCSDHATVRRRPARACGARRCEAVEERLGRVGAVPDYDVEIRRVISSPNAVESVDAVKARDQGAWTRPESRRT